jgi:O-antigen ligase
METLLWICAVCVVFIIASIIFFKPYLGVIFVIVSIPFEGMVDSSSISLYPLEVILAILVFVCIYKGIVERYNCFGNMKLVYCCIPFMLCITFSAIKSIELSLTVKEIVRWLELAVIYYLTINLINDNKKKRVVLYSIFFTVAMVSIFVIINLLCMGHREFPFFGNPNPLAGYVNLTIPILLGMLMTSVFLWERIVLGVFTLLSVMTWFLALSRTAWVSLVLTMILILFLTKANKRVLLLSAIFIIVFAVSILSSNFKSEFIARVKLQPALSSLEPRVMYYPVGLDMLRDNFIFGIGIGNYPLLIKKFTEKVYLIKTNLHCLYLQVFIETGVMGLSAFAFWLICIVKYLVSSLKELKNTKNYSLFVGLVSGVVVYLFNNLAETLTVHGIHLQWGIILGLAVVLTQLRESETCPKTV